MRTPHPNAGLALLSLLSSCVVPFDADGDGARFWDDCDDQDPALQQRVYYLDADGDGLGDPKRPISSCRWPEGYYSDVAGDCDDGDRRVPLDEVKDDDGDGFMDAACVGGDDCDDDSPIAFPGAPRTCYLRLKDAQLCDGPEEPLRSAPIGIWMRAAPSETVAGEVCDAGLDVSQEGAPQALPACQTVRCADWQDYVGYAHGSSWADVTTHPNAESTMCCACELGEALSQSTLSAPTVITARADGMLGLCDDGELPLAIEALEGAAVDVYGARIFSWQFETEERHPSDKDECALADEGPHTTLVQGVGHPVVRAEGAGTVRLFDLTLHGAGSLPAGEACDDSAETSVIALEDTRRALLERVCVTGGASTCGGGLRAVGSVEDELSFSEVIVDGSRASIDGGGVWIFGPNLLGWQEVRLANNEAGRDGGGIWVAMQGVSGADVSIYLADGLIVNNVAGEVGGGIWFDGDYTTDDNVESSMYLDGVSVLSNRAVRGGGIALRHGLIGVDNLGGGTGELYGNTATDVGGGLYLFGSTYTIRTVASLASVSCQENEGGCAGLEGLGGDGRALNTFRSLGTSYAGNVYNGDGGADVVIIGAGVVYDLGDASQDEWLTIEATDTH